jgi:phosphatidylinositol alpha-1,6-mannosyltransferase
VAAVARHLLVTNDYPPKVGGIQVYLHELWRRLEPGRAVIVTARSHDGADAFDDAATENVERLSRRLLFFPTPRARRDIESAIERHDPSLVLLDPVWPLGILGRHLSRPYGIVLHGAEVTIPSRIPLVRRSLRRVLSGASVVVCAGRYPEAVARACAGPEMPPVVQVPPGVDTSRFRPLDVAERRRTRRRLGLDEGDLLVVSYSRLVPRKGMDTLIRASAILAPRFPELVVLIGGSGRDRRRLEALIAKTGAPVRLVGRVDDEALAAFVGAADLMVMDCRTRLGVLAEGFGIVFVEAASCEVAAIAGRSGGSDEAVVDGETGVVVSDTRSPVALARAIERLLVDVDSRRRLSSRARALAVEHYDWDTLALALASGLTPFDRPAS